MIFEKSVLMIALRSPHPDFFNSLRTYSPGQEREPENMVFAIMELHHDHTASDFAFFERRHGDVDFIE
jgi:hypothetical protein